MIIKNTKIVFENGETKELKGGIPLSKGEMINFHAENSEEIIDYEVVEKTVDCIVKGEDQIINITYVLRKKY